MFEVFRGVDDADGFRAGEDAGEATVSARPVGEFEGQVEDADVEEFQGADDLVKRRRGSSVFPLEGRDVALDVCDRRLFEFFGSDEGVEAFGDGGVAADGFLGVLVRGEYVPEGAGDVFGER